MTEEETGREGNFAPPGWHTLAFWIQLYAGVVLCIAGRASATVVDLGPGSSFRGHRSSGNITVSFGGQAASGGSPSTLVANAPSNSLVADTQLDDCCAAHDSGGCADDFCTGCVCFVDSFCCDNAWDDSCVTTAANDCDFLCGCSASPPPTPTPTVSVGNNCCAPHAAPGCNVSSCENCVCDATFDDCCFNDWDQTCTTVAANECASSCGCGGSVTPTRTRTPTPPPEPCMQGAGYQFLGGTADGGAFSGSVTLDPGLVFSPNVCTPTQGTCTINGSTATWAATLGHLQPGGFEVHFVAAANVPAGTRLCASGFIHNPTSGDLPAGSCFTTCGPPTATASPSRTPSPTRTRTFTPTRSPTPTFTPRPSLTPTRTPTSTPTRSPTPTFTRPPIFTQTRTPTLTATRTPSFTPTRTPTFAATQTPRFTLTPTPPFTVTQTPSSTATGTPAFTATHTSTSRATATITSSKATFTPTLTPTTAPTPICAADCNGNGEVTVDELITGVNIALGNALLSTCAVFDASGDGTVTINELIVAVNKAVSGCA